MLLQTRGIVLHVVPYSDSSLIVKMYTEESGLTSYIVSASRSRKGKSRAVLLQPLTQLDLVVMHKEKNSLQRITEFSCHAPYQHLHEDMVKTSIALFIAEMLYKSLREEESNSSLYTFLSGSLQILDLRQGSMVNFHLCFLMRLSRHLGFFPHDNQIGERAYFDLQEGVFVLSPPPHPFWLDPSEAALFARLQQSDYESMDDLQFSNNERRILLEKMILFYELHLSSVKDVKSHKVLEEVLS